MSKSIKSIGRWLGRRLRERSTYAGAAVIAVAVGAPAAVIEHIGTAGQIAAIIFGTGVAAATTSVHPTVDELIGR